MYMKKIKCRWYRMKNNQLIKKKKKKTRKTHSLALNEGSIIKPCKKETFVLKIN